MITSLLRFPTHPKPFLPVPKKTGERGRAHVWKSGGDGEGLGKEREGKKWESGSMKKTKARKRKSTGYNSKEMGGRKGEEERA